MTKAEDLVASWKEELPALLNAGPVFAVIDPAVEERFAISTTLQSLLPGRGVAAFTSFPPNPTWESLQAAVVNAQSSRAQTIVAIGGGTAMDLAKLCAAALQVGGIDSLWKAGANGGDVAASAGGPQLVAIPTTAGTGAEATRFAVLYRGGIKHSLAGEALLPKGCVLDPSLLTSLPRSVTADAGLDAVCQAMESLWSVRSTPASERFAWAALEFAVHHLEAAVRNADEAALTGMLVAAHLAGKAINLTTTTAPHALSYGLTSRCGVPHGRAVAWLFGPIFRVNLAVTTENCAHPGGPEMVIRRLEAIALRWGQSAERFPDWWNRLLREQLAIPSLPAGADRDLVDQLTASVNAARLANNPRLLTPGEIRAIYEEVG